MYYITNSFSPRHSTRPTQDDHQRGQARSQGLEARLGGQSWARRALAGHWPAPSAAPDRRGGGRRRRAAGRRRGRSGQAGDAGQGRQETEEAGEGGGDLPPVGPLPLGLSRLRLGGTGDAGLQGGEGLPPLRPCLGRSNSPPPRGAGGLVHPRLRMRAPGHDVPDHQPARAPRLPGPRDRLHGPCHEDPPRPPGRPPGPCPRLQVPRRRQQRGDQVRLQLHHERGTR